MPPMLLLACDNCVPGDQGPYRLLLLGIFLGGGILGIGLLVLAGIASTRWRHATTALVAAGCLSLTSPVAVLVAETPTTWHGVTCGSALSASLTRGVPDDRALDSNQLGCKAAGLRWVRAAEIGAGAAWALGAAWAASTFVRRRPRGPLQPG
jgi:hypothetical protein